MRFPDGSQILGMGLFTLAFLGIARSHPLSTDEVDLEDRGDRWTFVNVLPRSGFIQTVHHGKRMKEEGEAFVKTVK